MRNTSFSMHQSKAPNANTNKFGSMVEGTSMIRSSFQPNKKVEGHDMIKTSKTNFQQTVTNLKTKPTNKVLEDEYIKGLQQQIKFLEYQLKLLKDKQIMQRQGVNQLDNFLKDQIPINENILAMKNKYNATKSKLQQSFRQLLNRQVQATTVLQTQKNQINRLHDLMKAHRDQTQSRRKEFKQKIAEVVMQLTLTKEQYQAITNENKTKQQQVKKMNEQIMAIYRINEKQRVQEVRLMEQKAKGTQKFQEKFKEIKQNAIESIQKIEELKELGDVNPLVVSMQKENSLLQKKIMLNEKQRSTADNMIAQMDLVLKEQAKDREIQRDQKQKLIIAADTARNELQNLQRFMDNLVNTKTTRTKKILLKQMSNDYQSKEELYDLLTDRLRTLEQDCSNLIMEKKELQDFLDQQITVGKDADDKISFLEHSIVGNKSQTQSIIKVTEESAKQIMPIKTELQKFKGMIPIYQGQIQKVNKSIEHLNKQIDLLKELKTLDLQQLQMVSRGGSQVQNVLHNFIKNWGKIKSK